MGRQYIGTTDVKMSQLYSSCWRQLQQDPLYYSDSSFNPKNLRLCNFLNYRNTANSIASFPWVNGGNVDVTTNLSMTADTNQYLFFQAFQFAGPANGTMNVKWPNSSTYPYANVSARETNGDNGQIGYPFQFWQNATSYFSINYSANVGYEIDGWYTSKLGGSLITTSTAYNFTYNGANDGASAQAKWWLRTQSSGPSVNPYLSSTMGVFNQACNFNGSNPGLTQTYYHDGAGSLPAQGDTVYSNSGGSIVLNAGYYNINNATGLGNRQYILVTSGGIVDVGYPAFC